ncbi:MAG: amino acid ABC transporter permease [Thiotrichales bacterium]
MAETQFQPSPSLPPPKNTIGVWGWMRANLFSDITNSILTILALFLLWKIIPPIIDWAIIKANFAGSSRDACTGEGACWVFIKARFSQFLYGRYPEAETWRINLGAGLLIALVIPLFLKQLSGRIKFWLSAFILIIYPIIAGYLFYGGVLGLQVVETNLWGGLFLTLVISIVGIVASIPLGVMLALGRQSEMPIIKALSTMFIELWRGVPLITVLFMASVMLPLFLPEGMNFDKLVRAMIGITLFESAYMAEVIRGGLQAIPKGQYEAADALGLGYWKKMGLVILPQALKLVIPGIVNTVIALFKDTTLVLIVGLFDLLGIIQLALTDPNWLGYSIEGYVFAALMFWIFCFSMSRYSQYLERKLHTGHR